MGTSKQHRHQRQQRWKCHQCPLWPTAHLRLCIISRPMPSMSPAARAPATSATWLAGKARRGRSTAAV